MITITAYKIKSFSQKSYDEFIKSIDIGRMTCSCGLSGQLIKHAYYSRLVKTPDGIITLRILRVKCKHCGRTHAIFPEAIVPYSQILINDHLSIIKAYNTGTSFESIMMSNEYIDESNIRYIIHQYLRHWKEHIAAFGLSLTDSVHALVTKCLKTVKRQFMQIKCITNVLFC